MLLLQSRSSTSLDRYTETTTALAHWANTWPEPSVLSFGCSSGAELLPFALLAPSARCLGVDIEPNPLEVGRKKFRDYPNVQFAPSSWATIRDSGPYHVAMANAVLCRYPDSNEMDDLSSVLPFSQFDEAIAVLVETLAPGGVLMVRHANYFVEETTSFRKLMPIQTPASPINSYVHKFGRDGKKQIMLNSRGAVAIREADRRNPFPRVATSLFQKKWTPRDAPTLNTSPGDLFKTPDYERQPGEGWRQVITMKAPQGWRPMPYQCHTIAVAVDGMLRMMNQYSRRRGGTATVIGEELLAPL